LPAHLVEGNRASKRKGQTDVVVIQAAILIFVAVSGTAVVLTRDPIEQVVGLSFYGILLALMFFIFQAPDVALSQIVIGTVALPLMFMLTLAKIRRDAEERERKKQEDGGKPEGAQPGKEAA
jgi:energy-converting hydrogenase B subunit D